MMYFIELIRYLPGRAEPEVLGRINHADRDPEGARAKAKSIFLQTKVAGAERVRVLNSDGVEILNWGGARSSIAEAELTRWLTSLNRPDLQGRPSIRGPGSHLVTPIVR